MDEPIPEVSCAEAEDLLEAGALFVDVRDPLSHRRGRIPGSVAVGDHDVAAFLASADPARTTVVYCYHGHSSIGGAAYFREHGLQDVRSMAGGFAEWAGPVEADPEPEPQRRPPQRAEPAPQPPPPAPTRHRARRAAKAVLRKLLGR